MSNVVTLNLKPAQPAEASSWSEFAVQIGRAIRGRKEMDEQPIAPSGNNVDGRELSKALACHP